MECQQHSPEFSAHLCEGRQISATAQSNQIFVIYVEISSWNINVIFEQRSWTKIGVFVLPPTSSPVSSNILQDPARYCKKSKNFEHLTEI
jgi:hypothetical protein